MYVYTFVCMCLCIYACLCMCMYVYRCICLYMCVRIYVYMVIYTGKQEGFEQRLQTATKHTKICKEKSLYANFSVCKTIKRKEPQVLVFLNMFKDPNLFSFVLAIILTSVSIPFIIFYVWILTIL